MPSTSTIAPPSVAESLASIERLNPRLAAFVRVFADAATAAGRLSEERHRAGRARSALDGVTMGVKDIISTIEGPTTAQSRALPAEWGRRIGDATVVSRLRSAGAVIVGKTSTMEFACGTPGDLPDYDVPENPWALGRWPGGSSSGTAIAVASGMVSAGLGTDTAGSIRIPAAYCGVTGLKPTVGRVPTHGCVPYGASLDCIGPIARSAEECGMILAILLAEDQPAEPPPYAAPSPGTADLTGVTIGVDDLSRFGNQDPAVTAAFGAATQVLSDLGADLRQVELPLYEEISAVCGLLVGVEAFDSHRENLARAWDGYGASTRLLLASGALLGAPDYRRLQRVRRHGQQRIADAFTTVDAILTPTVSSGAFPHDEMGARLAERAWTTLYTMYWNVLGNPALSVPMGFDGEGLPLGLQIAGRPFEEDRLVAIGAAFQQRTTWHTAVPAMDGGTHV